MRVIGRHAVSRFLDGFRESKRLGTDVAGTLRTYAQEMQFHLCFPTSMSS